MSYTDEELLAVARVVWPHVSHDYAHFRAATLHGLSCAWLSYGTESVREFAVRLALAYPTKAGEALGPGWEVAQWEDEGHELQWWGEGSAKGWVLRVTQAGEVWILGSSDAPIPPEFDAALARARLIAAAWARIETAKEA